MVARRVIERQIIRDAEAAAVDVALELVSMSDPARLIQEPGWSSKLIRRLSLRSGLRGVHIEITSEGRTHVLEASSTQSPIEPLISFDEVEYDELVWRTSEHRVEVVVRYEARDAQVAIRVLASTEVIGQFIDVAYQYAVWVGLAAWVLLVLTILLIIKRTVRSPLQKVADAMTQVGEGRLQQRVDVVGAREVEPLIQAFNRMALRLAQTESERSQLLQEVEGFNLDLQRRVAKATAALASAQVDLARRDRLSALGELVGTIAHEVGTPLNSVLAHLDLLGEDLPQDIDRGRLEIAIAEIERVSDIIRRYLRTTRAPSPRHEAVEIGSHLREAVRVFQSQATSLQVKLVINAGEETFPTDPGLLAQIVRNLVSNALTAVSSGGSIVVSTSRSEDYLELEVTDDGVGMDEETKRQIFEPFYTARPDGSGTGLGMSIVRNAVASLNGKINITSELGKGTTAKVVLKRVSGPEIVSSHDS